MKKNLAPEIIISGILIILVLIWLDPFQWLMPEPWAMTLIMILLLAYVIYLIFLWREKVADERESYHRLAASRNAWLAGTTVLIIGLTRQSLDHQIDPWIIYALVIMILAKIVSRIYQSLKN